MQPYFIFKNRDSREMGVIVNRLPSIFKPTKDIKKIEIQGRDGFLVQDFGSYRSTIKSIECTIENLDRMAEICRWLDGSGDLIMSNHNDKKYEATIINQIDFLKVIKQFHRFIIQFECQPFARELFPQTVVFSATKVLHNIGAVKAYPTIVLYGSGDLSININGNTFTVNGVNSKATIDSENLIAYENSKLLITSGEFPVLKLGKNAINVSGATKVEVTPNWRWI